RPRANTCTRRPSTGQIASLRALRLATPGPALNRGSGIEIDRIKRGLSADIEPVAALSSEADIGDQLSDRDRAQMRPVRRVAEDVAARPRPYFAGDVAT